MNKKIFNLSPGRVIALSFAAAILIGSVLLMLPVSTRPGHAIGYIDALYMSASAVCVTGLVTVDPGITFTPVGQFFLGLLIQIGGLGLTTIGAGLIIAMGKKVNLRGRSLIREAGNLENSKGAIRFVKQVLITTFTFELVGAALSFIVFIQEYPFWPALGYSLFHSVAAFNNSGFDIFGHSGEVYSNNSLLAYHDNIFLNLVTIGLIIFGGIGFLVIQEMRKKKFRWKNYSMHAKVVLTTTLVLIVGGTLLIKLTEHSESWLGAFFQSVTTRTAGFSTSNIGNYSSAGIMVISILMLIGASPGSTGGGIKTTTFFVLLKGMFSAATNKSEKAFRYAIPRQFFRKAAIIILLAFSVIFVGTYFMLLMDPYLSLVDALFENISAFGTVGLSMGITSGLSVGSKILTIFIMYIGRLGPLTIATLWYFTKGERVSYPEGNIAIG